MTRDLAVLVEQARRQLDEIRSDASVYNINALAVTLETMDWRIHAANALSD